VRICRFKFPLWCLTTVLLLGIGQAQARIKNVILVIGDGMGPQQVGLLETYAQRAPNSIYKGKPTAFSKLSESGYVGLSTHWPMDAMVVDSACSATQLALGVAAPSESIGVDANGNTQMSILEQAKKVGKATGLVSDTRLTHATPAAFAAHQPHRSLENEIALDMLNAAPDVMLSGGLRHWIPASVNSQQQLKESVAKLVNEPNIQIKSKRKDERNLLLEAKVKGYELAFNKTQLDAVKGNKILGLFAYSGMLEGVDYSHQTATHEPSLPEMTMKAINALEKHEQGFFLMVEAGQIDWAAHANDAGAMLHEMIKIDHTLDAILTWVKTRDDTLVVVTADHETGGFGLSYSRHNIPKKDNLEGEHYKGKEYQYAPNFNFGALETLDAFYSQKKSLYTAYADAIAADADHPTAKALMEQVNRYSGFEITLEDAKQVLEHRKNTTKIPGHDYLNIDQVPRINDFEHFYVYGEDDHSAVLARALAKHQNVVWGTGTHTHTPVPVYAYGPDQLAKQYSKQLHHARLGKMLQAHLLGLPDGYVQTAP
jgi:alkaline phosphatase